MQLEEEEELVAQMAFNSVVQKILTNEPGNTQYPQVYPSNIGNNSSSNILLSRTFHSSSGLSVSASPSLPASEIQDGNSSQWSLSSVSNPLSNMSPHMSSNDFINMNRNMFSTSFLDFPPSLSDSIPASESSYSQMFGHQNRHELSQSGIFKNLYRQMSFQNGMNEILKTNFGMPDMRSITEANSLFLHNNSKSLLDPILSEEISKKPMSSKNAPLNQSQNSQSNLINQSRNSQSNLKNQSQSKTASGKAIAHVNVESKQEKRCRDVIGRGSIDKHSNNLNLLSEHHDNSNHARHEQREQKKKLMAAANTISSDPSISMSDSGTGDENLKFNAIGYGKMKGEGLKTDDKGKRLRRMKSNRDSARRSRLKRQQRLEELEITAAQLRVENASLARKAKEAIEKVTKTEAESLALKLALEELKRELKEYQSNETKESTKQESTNSVEIQTQEQKSKQLR